MKKNKDLTINIAVSEMDRRRSKRPPELQIHASATLVAHGDPFALDEIERKDLSGEVAQFCVTIESKWLGQLKKHHIEKAFAGLSKSVYIELKKHGVFSAGE